MILYRFSLVSGKHQSIVQRCHLLCPFRDPLPLTEVAGNVSGRLCFLGRNQRGIFSPETQLDSLVKGSCEKVSTPCENGISLRIVILWIGNILKFPFALSPKILQSVTVGDMSVQNNEFIEPIESEKRRILEIALWRPEFSRFDCIQELGSVPDDESRRRRRKDGIVFG